MTYQFPKDTTTYPVTGNTILNEHGITLSVGTDFAAYARTLRKERKAQQLGAPFDHTKQHLDASNGFWILGRNEEGALIHTQAFKTIELNDVSLGTYLLGSYRKFPPPIPNVDFGRSQFRVTPGSRRISGLTTYHGEVWMAPDDLGRYRGKGLATLLTRFGLREAMQRWNPDWVFGFMLRAVAFKGFSERVGYMHTEPGALKWAVEERAKLIEAFLVYLSREDAQYMLELPVDELVAHAA